MTSKVTRDLATRLSIEGNKKFEEDMTRAGDAGERALKRVERATEPASKQLRVVDAVAREVSDTLTRSTASAGAFGRVLSTVGTVGVVASAGIGLAALATERMLSAQLQSADAQTAFALRIREQTEALSEYIFVQERASIGTGTFNTAIQRMERRLAQLVLTGTGEAKNPVERLNLDLEELLRKSPVEKFEAIVEAMDKAGGTQGSRLLTFMQFFDTEGVALLQTFGDRGVEALRELREEARDLNVTLTREQAEAFGNINTELTRIKSGIGGLSKEILFELAPAIQSSAEYARDFISGLNTLFSPSLDDRIQSVTGRLDKLNEAIRKGAPQFDIFGNDPRGPLQAELRSLVNEKSIADRARREREQQEAARREEDIEAQKYQKLLGLGEKYLEEFRDLNETAREKIMRETEEKIKDLERLSDDANRSELERTRGHLLAIRDIKLQKLDEAALKREEEAAQRSAEANEKIIEGLRRQREELTLTDREKFIFAQTSKLSADAASHEVLAVREQAAAYFDLRQELEEQKKIREAIHQEILGQGPQFPDSERDTRLLKESARVNARHEDPADRFAREAQELQDLRDEKLLNSGVFDRRMEEIIDTYSRGLNEMAEETSANAQLIKDIADTSARRIEDGFVSAYDSIREEGRLTTETVEGFFVDMGRAVEQEILRMAVFRPVTKGIVGGIGDFFGFDVLHEGGRVGDPGPRRTLPGALLNFAPRLHNGLGPNEFPAILERGEQVIPKNQNQDNAQRVLVTEINISNVIQALDATGVEEKLHENADTIKAIVQQAYTESGRTGGPLR